MIAFAIIVVISILGIVYVLITISKEEKNATIAAPETVEESINTSENVLSETQPMAAQEQEEPVKPVAPPLMQHEPPKKKIETLDDIVQEIKDREKAESSLKNIKEVPEADNLAPEAEIPESEKDKFDSTTAPEENIATDEPTFKESKKRKESLLNKLKLSVFKKEEKQNSGDEILHGVFDVKETTPQKEDKTKKESFLSKFNFLKKKEPIAFSHEDSLNMTPPDEKPEESPQAANVKKESLFNRINIFKKKEKDAQQLATEHYTSLKDFMEKTQGAEEKNTSKVSTDQQANVEQEISDTRIEKIQEEDETEGTASLRVKPSQQSDSTDSEDDRPEETEEDNSPKDLDRPSLMEDIIEESEETDENEESSRAPLEANEAEEPVLKEKATETQAPLETEEDPPLSEKKPQDTPDINEEGVEPLDENLIESDESLQNFKELENKYESLNQLLKEKSEDLEKAQETLNNELKNREDYQKVKNLLEEELLDVKDRARQIQKEKESLETEFAKTNNILPELEEKANKLEEELLKREEELKISVERYENLQAELEAKNKAVETHIQQISEFNETNTVETVPELTESSEEAIDDISEAEQETIIDNVHNAVKEEMDAVLEEKAQEEISSENFDKDAIAQPPAMDKELPKESGMEQEQADAIDESPSSNSFIQPDITHEEPSAQEPTQDLQKVDDPDETTSKNSNSSDIEEFNASDTASNGYLGSGFEKLSDDKSEQDLKIDSSPQSAEEPQSENFNDHISLNMKLVQDEDVDMSENDAEDNDEVEFLTLPEDPIEENEDASEEDNKQ